MAYDDSDNRTVGAHRIGSAWGFALDPEETWVNEGLCAQTDPEAFFPEKGGSTRAAKHICGGCDVKDACLQYALDHDERFGIWGGLSERERRRLKRGDTAPLDKQRERVTACPRCEMCGEPIEGADPTSRLKVLLPVLPLTRARPPQNRLTRKRRR